MMKQTRFTILLLMLCFLSAAATAQTAMHGTTSKNAGASLSGTWLSVDNKEFLIMNDGFFSSVAQDSTGKWSEFHAGTYTLQNGHTAILKVSHSSFAYRIGYLHTIEYKLEGDKLTFNLYKKMIDPKAGDVTDRMPKGVQSQYNRAKQ